jgi:hypothetical protein
MTAETAPHTALLLTAKANVPQFVVYRSFPSETVVLNLETGQYHGLNATAGQMLETLVNAPSVGEAVAALAAAYEQPRATVEADLCKLCSALLARGLIEVDECSVL